jgi:hypothetical protein
MKEVQEEEEEDELESSISSARMDVSQRGSSPSPNRGGLRDRDLRK